MSEASIRTRAEQIVAMLTPEKRESVSRKAAGGKGAPPSAFTLAMKLATQEAAKGFRTAKVKLPKALVAINRD